MGLQLIYPRETLTTGLPEIFFAGPFVGSRFLDRRHARRVAGPSAKPASRLRAVVFLIVKIKNGRIVIYSGAFKGRRHAEAARRLLPGQHPRAGPLGTRH